MEEKHFKEEKGNRPSWIAFILFQLIVSLSLAFFMTLLIFLHMETIDRMRPKRCKFDFYFVDL